MTALTATVSRPQSAEVPSPPPRAPQGSEELEAVKAMMLQLATGDRFERLGAIVQEHLFSAGKRLRARLAMSAIEALSGPSSARVPWAAACELLHNATLIHDDLQDGDVWRRGRYAVWVRHGQAQAINAGDLLLMLPYLALDHLDTDDGTRWRLTRSIARRAEQTVRGQSREMTLLGSGGWNWTDYSEAATGKTSALFALPVEGAALLSGRSVREAEKFGDCFAKVGLLFQMQDDVLDLYGDKQREARGNDIREGSVTALVVEHLTRMPDDEKWIVSVLAQPRDETSTEAVERIIERFARTGTLDIVLDRIERLAEETLLSPTLRTEPALADVAREMIDRCLSPIAGLLAARRAGR